MKEFFFWYLGVEAVGLAAFPLAFFLFRRLPDRGFALSKVLGLLLLGYGLWISVLIGALPNTRGSVIGLLLLIAAVSAVVALRCRRELSEFLRGGWRYVAFVEGLFLAVLAAAVFIRSFAPDIVWGEKPFELAFLNSIARSESFPPADPWLSGHSISYYYFGYVMVAALGKLVALSTSVTFYLGLSLVAALAAVSAFGLVYNMVIASGGAVALARRAPLLAGRALAFGLVAATLMLVVSNLEGVFELMARHGLGSKALYDALGIYGLPGPYDCQAVPADCQEWYPTRYWWWWWATRMGSEFDIQEFPFFSFQFGDLHPHVLAMPFLIALLTVAFQLVLAARLAVQSLPFAAPDAAGLARVWRRLRPPVGAGAVAGMVAASAWAVDVSTGLAVLLAVGAGGVQFTGALLAERWRGPPGDGEALDARWWLANPLAFALLGLLLGGATFLDAWAMPLASMLLLAAAAVANWLRTGGSPLRTLADTVGFALPLLAAGIFFYLPFYLHFEADTRGLGMTQAALTFGDPPPNSETTRPVHFLLFWAPLLWPVMTFVALYSLRNWRAALKPGPLALSLLAWFLPAGLWAWIILWRDGAGVLWDEMSERGANLVTVGFLAVSITAVGLAFLDQLRRRGQRDPGHLFAFFLAGFALLMLFGAEFYYVADFIGWRANTVFRFWHQSWILLSIAGGFGLYRLTLAWRWPELRAVRVPWALVPVLGVVFGAAYTLFVALDPWESLYSRWWSANLGIIVAGASLVAYVVAAALRRAPASAAVARVGWLGVTVVVLGSALVYPVAVIFERTDGFTNHQRMDGLAHFEQEDPDEFQAIEWLRHNVDGAPIILEAVGRDFSDYARVSSRTGLPTVIGWLVHERQWRGDPPASEASFTARMEDVATIYNTTDVAEAEALIEKYQVEYVYVGRLERRSYSEEGLAKFERFMTPVFENPTVTIYRLPPAPAAARNR